MLILKPNCECCDKDLPNDAEDAMMCSYECTFCKDCVDDLLSNVCPNCGGGFVPRPMRPTHEHRPEAGLKFNPASTKRVNTLYTRDELVAFTDSLKHIPPAKR